MLFVLLVQGAEHTSCKSADPVDRITHGHIFECSIYQPFIELCCVVLKVTAAHTKTPSRRSSRHNYQMADDDLYGDLDAGVASAEAATKVW